MKKIRSKNKGIILLNKVITDMKKDRIKTNKNTTKKSHDKIDDLLIILQEHSRNLAVLLNDSKNTIGRIDFVSEKINKLTLDVEDLAIMTAKQFSEIRDEIDEKLGGINQRLDGMSNRIDDATVGKVSMQQHEALALRVGKIEEKIA